MESMVINILDIISYYIVLLDFVFVFVIDYKYKYKVQYKSRAAEIVGLSPILSWPRIIFSESLC